MKKKKLILIILILISIFIGVIIGRRVYYIRKNKLISSSEKISKKDSEEKRVIELFNNNLGGQVYLEIGASDDEIEQVKNKLEKIDNIGDIQFVSSEDALELMKEKISDSSILEGYEANIFPASYTFKIRIKSFDDIQSEFYNNIYNEIEKIDNIKTIRMVDASNLETYIEIYRKYGIEALEAFFNNDFETFEKYYEKE